MGSKANLLRDRIKRVMNREINQAVQDHERGTYIDWLVDLRDELLAPTPPNPGLPSRRDA